MLILVFILASVHKFIPLIIIIKFYIIVKDKFIIYY